MYGIVLFLCTIGLRVLSNKLVRYWDIFVYGVGLFCVVSLFNYIELHFCTMVENAAKMLKIIVLTANVNFYKRRLFDSTIAKSPAKYADVYTLNVT